MERIPTIFGVSPFVILSIVLVAVVWFVLSKTSLGLRIRSVGENPAVAEVSGISVARTRYLCVIVAGMLMGFAGAVYSLDYNPVWSYNFLMGWGFIALALVFFSLWNPWILLGGSVLFGTLWQLSLNPQIILPGLMSRYIWRTVPFVITLVVLMLMSRKRRLVGAIWPTAPMLSSTWPASAWQVPARPIAGPKNASRQSVTAGATLAWPLPKLCAPPRTSPRC